MAVTSFFADSGRVPLVKAFGNDVFADDLIRARGRTCSLEVRAQSGKAKGAGYAVEVGVTEVVILLRAIRIDRTGEAGHVAAAFDQALAPVTSAILVFDAMIGTGSIGHANASAITILRAWATDSV